MCNGTPRLRLKYGITMVKIIRCLVHNPTIRRSDVFVFPVTQQRHSVYVRRSITGQLGEFSHNGTLNGNVLINIHTRKAMYTHTPHSTMKGFAQAMQFMGCQVPAAVVVSDTLRVLSYESASTKIAPCMQGVQNC